MCILLIILLPLEGISISYNELSELTIVIPCEIHTLNMYAAKTPLSKVISELVMDPLVRYDAELNPIPWIVENWTYGAEYRVWVLRIRKDVRWSDGEDLKAADVAFTLNMLREHGPPYLKSWLRIISEIEVKEEYCLVVKLKRSFPYFIHVLTLVSPLREKELKEVKDLLEIKVFNITIGPYKLERWDKDLIVLEAREDYFVKPRIKRINFLICTNPEVSMELFRKGEADVVTLVNYSLIPNMINDPSLKLIMAPSMTSLILSMNIRRSPLDMQCLREAISLSINRTYLMKSLFRDYAIYYTSIIPPLFKRWSYINMTMYEFDRQRALGKLREGGIEDTDGDGWLELGGKDVELSLVFCDSDEYMSKIAHAIKRDLESIGIRVALRGLRPGKYVETVFEKFEYDLALFYTPTFLLPPALSIYMVAHSEQDVPHGFNLAGIHDAALSERIERMSYTMNFTEAKVIANATQRLLAVELRAYLPILMRFQVEVIRGDLDDYSIMPWGIINIETFINIRPKRAEMPWFLIAVIALIVVGIAFVLWKFKVLRSLRV